MSVYERLAFDAPRDLEKLVAFYLKADELDYDCAMAPLFALAAQKGPTFMESPEVMGISIGGSNTKVALAKMTGGGFAIRHFIARPNPPQPMPFDDFMDEILLKDPVFSAYLRGSEPVRIGVSIPVPIQEGIPVHRTKVATVTGLIARSTEEKSPALHFGNNLGRYLVSRGFHMDELYYNMDAIVAHLGGVTRMDTRPGDQSVLVVCGTGFATADDNWDRFIGMACLPGEDEELYPASLTEDCQYQYALAGKGMYVLMRLAIQARSREEDSALKGFDADRWFSVPRDSKTVYRLWQAALNHQALDGAAEIQGQISGRAFEELTALAALLCERAYQRTAHATIATLIKVMLKNPQKKPCYHIVQEGSVILNEDFNPRMRDHLQVCIEDGIFGEHGLPVPELIWDAPTRVNIVPGENVPSGLLREVDNTIVGACAGIIAASALR